MTTYFDLLPRDLRAIVATYYTAEVVYPAVKQSWSADENLRRARRESPSHLVDMATVAAAEAIERLRQSAGVRELVLDLF